MDKTIEREFFKAFDYGGVVGRCLMYMNHEYGFYEKDAEWEKLEQELFFQIKKGVESFNENVLYDESLFNEIEANIDECKDDISLKNYLYSLIMPFKQISDVCYPFAKIKKHERMIAKYEAELKEIQPPDYGEDDFDLVIELKREAITKAKDFILKTKEVMDCFNKRQHSKEGTVTYEYIGFRIIANMYAMHIDAILLRRRIDFLELQNECGVYVTRERNIISLGHIIGSEELVETLISNLPSTKSRENLSNKLQIHPKLNTPEARKVLDKAIEIGLITVESDRYVWVGEFKERKELAYFVKEFNVTILNKPREIKETRHKYNNEKFVISPFEEMFKVSSISQEIQKTVRKGKYKKIDIFFSSL